MILNYVKKSNNETVSLDLDRCFAFIFTNGAEVFSLQCELSADWFYKLESDAILDLWLDGTANTQIPHAIACFMHRWQESGEF